MDKELYQFLHQIKIDSPTSIGIGNTSDRPIDIDASTLDIDSSGDIK